MRSLKIARPTNTPIDDSNKLVVDDATIAVFPATVGSGLGRWLISQTMRKEVWAIPIVDSYRHYDPDTGVHEWSEQRKVEGVRYDYTISRISNSNVVVASTSLNKLFDEAPCESTIIIEPDLKMTPYSSWLGEKHSGGQKQDKPRLAWELWGRTIWLDASEEMQQKYAESLKLLAQLDTIFDELKRNPYTTQEIMNLLRTLNMEVEDA